VILVFRSLKNNKDGAKISSGLTNTQASVMEIDTDKDGLPDWKEALWKTNPNNSDTDADGTSDGEEIKLNRNPLKPAPGDEFTPEEIKNLNQQDGTPEFNQISKTSELAEKFLNQYVLQKSLNSGILDDAAKDALMKSVLGEVSTELPFRTYTISDIKISDTDNTEDIKQYGNEMGAIAKKYNPRVRMDEISSSLKIALETKNKDGLYNIKIALEKYTNIINESLKISVPRSAVNVHLDFLNGASRMAEIFLGMYRAIDDPFAALVAIGDVQNTASELIDSNKKISDYFDRKNITYKTNENGYVFVNNVFE